MSMTTLSLIGFFLAFCAMAYMCMKSYNLYIASIVAASIAILLSGLPLGQTLMKHYAPGFASFMSSYFFRYLWGAIFGILMEKCGGISAVFSGSDKDGWRYIIGSKTVDLRRETKRINAAINGRGGGTERMIQGRALAEEGYITSKILSLKFEC